MGKKSTHTGTALITGASQRIGQVIAFTLSSLGYQIALHYHHSHQMAHHTASEIRKNGGICELFSCDLADEEETLNLIKDVHNKFPNLNVLINNASIFERSKFLSSDLKLFNKHFAVNLKSPFILCSEFKAVCKRGQIINILDTDIVKNRTSHVAYLLTKKSLAELTKMAALEFAPDIRVNGIAPGCILPPKGQTNDYLERQAQRVPLKRKGAISDVSRCVQFLLENDYVTGQFIFCDGGEHLAS